MVEEYDLETFDLGPLTYEQAMEEATNSVKEVNQKLKAKIEKNKRLEKEVNACRNYVQQFQQPLTHQSLVATPPPLLPPETVDHMEKMKNSAQLLEVCVNKSFTMANEFLRNMMKILGRAIQVLEIVHNIMVIVDAFTHTKDVTIPVLQAIRKAPRQMLVQEGIIRKESTPNLFQWSTLLQMKKLLFEDVSNRCS